MTEVIQLLILVLPIHLAVMVTPGPNFFLLSTTALTDGRRSAVFAAFGIAIGSLIWMLSAALGVAALLKLLPTIGLVLNLVGAAYLMYLGFKLWASSSRIQKSKPIQTGVSSFRRGLAINLTSPKSAAYFAGVFAMFVSADTSFLALFFLICLLFLLSIAWHTLLATAFSTQRAKEIYQIASKPINQVAALCLIGFGLRLVFLVLKDLKYQASRLQEL
ncbi:MAG: LysE family transporter [Pseudomonadota bacterium]